MRTTLYAFGIACCVALALLAGCSSNSSCTNITRTACDPDAGSSCPTNFGCVAVQDAIDPCPSGAAGCCFQICSTDSQCQNSELCTASGVCAQGRCFDGG
ncbi:MAG: hypothetical protein JST54_09740 [Deltaproteobacteria bacterium]|nr:hypothetical protein [Deltaproteobacteria bacterium]